jgi:hypothetical protein
MDFARAPEGVSASDARGLLRRAAKPALSVFLAVGALALPARALAQQPAPEPPVDMELDPDAPKPAPEPPKEEPPLPPAEPGAWGVGGEEHEGRFAPPSKKNAEEEEDTGPVDRGPKARVGVDAVIGFGKVNVVDEDGHAPTDATVFSFVPFVRYRFGDTWNVGVRFPFSTGSTHFRNADVSSFAVGNLALDVNPTFVLSRHLKLPVTVSFFLPSAQGDYFADKSRVGAVPQAVVNQAAASSRGFEDKALFASKRIGISPGLGLLYDRDAMHFAAGTKLEVMGRVGGDDPIASDPFGSTVRGLTTNWVTGASFFYDFLGGFVNPGLRAWVSVFSTPATQSTVDYSGAQFVLEPEIATRVPLSKSTKLGAALGYILPISGELGGVHEKASMNGLRIRAELLF